MFLGVSGTVFVVLIPDELRPDFARRLEAVRIKLGDRKAAYTMVGVNAATWTRAETGLSLKEGSEVKIIRRLWPASDGDWRKIEPPLRVLDEGDETAIQVRRSNLPEQAKARILRMLGEEGAEEMRRTAP